MPRKYKVHLTQNGQNDLEHIFFYIASDNLNNAKTFILELEEVIYTLETLPEHCPLIPENIFFKTSYRHLIYKKYRAIYKISHHSVFILRIIHGSKLLEL